jgi:ATP-dependent Lhr-like helicase
VLPGRFSAAMPSEDGTQWCDRALLARIHRYTVNRLRAEIEPVTPADFVRFLFKWQHVDPADRLTGIDGLREALALLDGCEIGAAAWERAVLPARVDGYDASMLDMLCLAGEAGWARLSAPMESDEPPRLAPATPIALFLREHAEAWSALRPQRGGAATDAARRMLAALQDRGASFFGDLVKASGLTDADARAAIGTLVASGLAASDGFSGLRALLVPADAPARVATRRATFAGRWSAMPAEAASSRDEAIEAQARALLRRYGVMFRRLAARESQAAPWRDLARVYRRLEARGEIRGGRFVSGMSGEQFALAGAVERLREVRRSAPDGRVLTVSTADPLNLVGIVTAGDRLRPSTRNRIAWRDGVPIAVREADGFRPLTAMNAVETAAVAHALARPHRMTAAV